MTSAAASAPSRPHGAEVVAVGEPVEEPGGVEVAGAGGVDDLRRPGAASTTCTSSPRTITEPFSLRVSAAISQWWCTRCSAASKSSTS